MNCNPQSLANLARCFTCLPGATLQEIKTYLLCRLANVGGFGQNLIPTGSQYTGTTPTFTLTVLPNTTYQITWGANDVSMLMGGVTYNSTGAGTTVYVFTKSSTQMVFTGTFAGTTVTVRVVVAPIAAIPIPTGFSFIPTGSGANVIASWDTPPAGPGVTVTELWTSPDNVTFTLAATVAMPTTSDSSTVAPAAGAFKYGKIRWGNSVGIFGGFTPSVSCFGTVADWAQRVITNGGAAVSTTTTGALNTFASALATAGIDGKMFSVICLVPDNLTAARTPLYKVAGNDPWTNTGFLAGDLTVNGLVGNAASKWLNSGVDGTLLGVGNLLGLTLYCHTAFADAGNVYDFGAQNVGGNTLGWLRVYDSVHGARSAIGGAVATTDSAVALRTGFFSGNRVSSTSFNLYWASSVTPFNTLGSNATANVNAVDPEAMALFCNLRGGVASFFVRNRLSFAAIHKGLTSAEAQALFNAVQALRTALGGGFV